ncbi:MAG: YhgE/Pip domain-containing protein [Arcanobacterium sp.]|nr:YhgE/Pip domain-containing protein [Arcanobacterium sp.]
MPRSLIIVVGVLVIPALYSWLNILAFWNPYEATDKLPIAVVNSDTGACSDMTGTINVGNLIVGELRKNNQLGWRFLDEDRAQKELRRGDVYAAFVIPSDFSKDLVQIFAGDRDRPTIKYLVNEKKGAIAPKITDAGASALDVRITSAFRERVGAAVAQAVRDGGIKLDAAITGAESSTRSELVGIGKDLSDAQSTVNSANDSVSGSFRTLREVRSALRAADPALASVETAIGDAQTVLSTVVKDAQTYSAAAGKASLAAQEALNQSTATATAAISDVTAIFDEIHPKLDKSIGRVNDLLESIRHQVSVLESSPLTARFAADVNERLNRAQKLINAVQQAHTDAGKARSQLEALADSFNKAVAAGESVATTTRTQATKVTNDLTSRVTQLSATFGRLSATVSTTRTSLTDVTNLVDGLEAQLTSTQDVLTQANGNLQGLQSGVQTAQIDASALASALQSGVLKTVTGIDAANIGRYLASPVKFDQQALFPVNSYGSGMAAMFINLSLWIGAFILIIIFRVEVDKEGFTWLKLSSAYTGRFMMLALFAAIQGFIVSVGSLLIGVQAANPLAIVATAVLLAPLYLAIIYALAASLSYVGRILAVVLVIIQIPGASGIYPIDLMPGFFQKIYPLLPFSYGISAMRETIGGFYDGRYVQAMAVVLFMAIISLVLGFIGRRHLEYFTRLFFEDLGRTELVVNESVQLQGANYRLSNVLALLANRKEFAARLAHRQNTFNAHYSVLVRTFTAIGLTGVAVLAVISRTTRANKPVLLAVAIVWGLIVIGALVAIEALKRSLMRAEELSHLSEDELVMKLLPYPAAARRGALEQEPVAASRHAVALSQNVAPEIAANGTEERGAISAWRAETGGVKCAETSSVERADGDGAKNTATASTKEEQE